jgi:hypothetical protein
MAQKKFYTTTPIGRTSFMDIFTPKVWEGDTQEDYQATMLFDSSEDVRDIKKTVNDCLAAEFGDNIPNMDMPWKKGEDLPDSEGNIRDGYKNKIAVRGKSKFKPIILDMNAEPMTDLDQDEFQSGDYARAKLEARVWTYAGKRGISLYLKVIQKIRTGERFGGGAEDLSDFTPVTNSGDAGQEAPF